MALQAYMPALQGSLGIRRPRNKYRNVAESYLSYCKKRKRRASRTRMLKRRMIKLLEKLLCQRDGIHSEYGALLRYTQDYQKRLSPYAAEAVRVRCVAADSIYANNANRKFSMQHRSMFNYQRFSILIGTNIFLTKNSFSMYKCKPLFFSLLLILFVPPFFIQILYIKNQV